MSISVTITITAAPGKFEELRDGLLANLSVTNEYEGIESLRLVAPKDSDNTLLMIQEWSTVEHYHAYKAWRTETKSSALKPDLIAGPPVTVFSEILF